MTLLSSSTAHNTIIWVINNGLIAQSNLWDHVMESCDWVKSPRGIMRDFFVEYNEESDTWDLKQWIGGSKLHTVDTYPEKELAQDALYTRVYECDFLCDDQRITDYWATKEEAEAFLQLS